ncbi:pepsin-like aspartate protease [Klosneuvirus KNV1]|uniref:Pepsin-like aspartate protease n=1 Tax=Klosneuvirus KNV1 TaxID=1977640 RepID=A0A1V0SKK9_9VIRU|nr:pepsin-like aspartate protease [Klosneuvirus KNV1]
MELTLFYQEKNQLRQVTVHRFDELFDLNEVYFGIKYNDQQIEFNGQKIDMKKSISDYSIKSGDLLIISQKQKLQEDYVENTMDDALISHTLLYLKAEFNDLAFKILIDTGAQVSVMGDHMAKLLNLSIDTRMKRKAHGVGVANIIGMAYNCNLKLEENFHVPINFNVMENDEQHLILLGLDFLNSHSCLINLVNRTIIINNKEFKLLNEIQVQELNTPYDCRKDHIKRLYKQMVSNINPEKRNEMIDILNKIMSNIIKNPSEDKYKNININNKVISDIIKENKDFIEFMKKIGFVMTNDHKLKFIENTKILDYTKTIMVA